MIQPYTPTDLVALAVADFTRGDDSRVKVFVPQQWGPIELPGVEVVYCGGKDRRIFVCPHDETIDLAPSRLTVGTSNRIVADSLMSQLVDREDLEGQQATRP